MPQTVSIGILLAAVGLGLSGCSELSQPTESSPSFGLAKGKAKVTICHKGKTITVASPALKAHMAHGDTEGPCGPACVAPPSGLVGWWPGDGNTLDIIGADDGALINGGTFAPGMVGQAFSFDGVDDFVQVQGPNINNLQHLTIDAWVKHHSLTPSRIERYVSLDGLPQGKATLRYDGLDGHQQLHFFMIIDNALWHVRANNVLQAGVFHHVAGTYDGSVMRMYLDGAEIGSLGVSGTVANGTSAAFSAGGEPLDGLLDEVEVYNRALTAAEIQALFDAGSAGKCKP